MKLGAAFLAFGLATLIRGQQTPPYVGPDGITTVATATCSTIGTQIYAYTDSSSIAYEYMCGGGSGGGSYGSIPSASVSSWQDCFRFCDTYVDPNGGSACSGFTYVSYPPLRCNRSIGLSSVMLLHDCWPKSQSI
jgi:hypothetical protein